MASHVRCGRSVLTWLLGLLWCLTPKLAVAEDQSAGDGPDPEDAPEEEFLIQAAPLDPLAAVLSAEQLQATPGLTVAEALEELPGVAAIRTAHGAAEPVLRGLSGERVRTQVGIVPLFGACPARMDPPLVYLLPQTTSALGLDFGADSPLAGPGAIGGRLSIRPDWERPHDSADFLASQAGLAFDGNGQRMRLGASALMAQGPVDGRLAVDVGTGSDYLSGAGLRVPGNHEHVGSSLSLAVRPADGQRFYGVVSYVRETDVDHPALPMDNDLTDFWVANLGYSLETPGRLERIEFEAGLSSIEHTMSNRDKPSRAQVDAVTPSTSLSAAAAGRLVLRLGPGLSLRSGLDFYHLARDAKRSRTMVATGMTLEDHIWPDTTEWDAGLSSEATWVANPAWVLVLGGRLDLVGSSVGALSDPSLQGSTIAEQFDRLYGPGAAVASRRRVVGSARAKVGWLPLTGLTAFFELAWTARAPSITERSFAFAPAPGGYQVGNPTLRPEEKTALELGVSWRSRLLELKASAFAYWVNDHILREVVERQDVNGDGTQDDVYGFDNVQAMLAGAELAVRIRPLDWLSFPISLASVHGWNRTGDRWLADVPPLSGRAAVRVERDDNLAWWLELGVSVAAAQTFVDEQVGEQPSQAHTLVGIKGGFEPLAWLRLEAGLVNLTDADYSPHLSRPVPMPAGDLMPGQRIPAPGLSAYVVATGRM